MRRAKDPIAKVLSLVGNLIERIRARLAAGTASADEGVYVFSSKWGTLALRGGDASFYRECRDALIDLHGKNTDERVLSRRAVESLLSETLLRTLRPALDGYNDSRPVFERRKKRELRALGKGLSKPMRRWQVAIEVTGLAPAVLPLSLGPITYVRGSKRNAGRLAAAFVDIQPGTRRVPMKAKYAKYAHPERDRSEITAMFSDNAIALLEVVAMDLAAARHLALNELRRNVDAINFFAPFFEHPVGPHVAHVAPSNVGTNLKYLVNDRDSWAQTFEDEPPSEWSLQTLKVKSRHGRKVGLFRVHELLSRENRSDIEDRILTAVMWAGRARAERRRDQAFLLYAIALEALVTKPSARSGVTERLKLRVAYVIHRRAASRRILVDTMDRLYKIRSALVHTGSAAELHDGDLKLIEWIAEHAIVHMLTRRPFRDMRHAGELEQWFEDRLLGA